MDVFFYNNKSDLRTIDKKLTKLYDNSFECWAKGEDFSILSPHIEVDYLGDDGVGTSIFKANYMYIKQFKRYYFIDDIVLSPGNKIIVKGSVDVLKSYASDIHNLNDVYVARQQNYYNDRYTDTNIPTKTDRYVYVSDKFNSCPFAGHNIAQNSYCVSITVNNGRTV